MPTTQSRTPLFRNAAVGPVAKGVSATVDVRIDGNAVKYVRVTASQIPDALDSHHLALNEATPVIDIPSTTPVEVEVTAIPLNSANRIRSVIVTSGKAGTTFDVEAIL